ncbi:hypothetical protein [Nocardiopsis sp. FIRDI 009]|uniref:hypothetical protein n=1 Tax=Nocardiopsis sp. FIRDI 009 TaxID=714197 RepID=UPI000E24A7E6|nr:hypothetical protein [Nocardiopsis sp. FIRDI 009]
MDGTKIVLWVLGGGTAVAVVVAASTLRAAPAPFVLFVPVLAAAVLIWRCRREIGEELGAPALLGAVAALPLFSAVTALAILDLVGTRCCAPVPGAVTAVPGPPCLCGFLGGDWFRWSLEAMFPVLAGDPRLPRLAVLLVLNAVVLTSSFFFLRGMAHVFGQRGLRLSALAMGATALIWAAWSRFPEGLDQLPDWPDPIRGGWTAALLVLLAGGYLWLETTAVRHEPSVQVSEPREQDDEATRRLNRELRLRLPGIEVLAPAWKPGAPPGQAVAALVENSDLPGAGVASALMRVLGLVLPVPPSYGVRVRADGPEGNDPEESGYVSATVEIHDRVSGRSLHQITLPPLRSDLAAVRAAGFVATRVFAEDPLIPDWAKGTYQGEDLAAYLLVKELPRLDRRYWERRSTDLHEDYDAFHGIQRERIRILRRVAYSRRVSGIVRYELASLYEQDGKHVKALRLHALNRAHYSSESGRNKIFQRSRYRMVVLLKMIANHRFADVWSAADPQDRRDVFHALRLAGLLPDGLREEGFVSPSGGDDGLRSTRLVLLRVAEAETGAMAEHFSRSRLVCENIRWRGKNPYSVLPPGAASQESPWRRWEYYDLGLRLLRSSIESRIVSAGGTPRPELPGRRRKRPARGVRDVDAFRRANPGWGTWALTYNKASLIATQRVESKTPSSEEEREEVARSVDDVIATLREALNPSVCEHYRPSELMACDPDLECMQGEPRFISLLREQYDRDWQVKPHFRDSLGQRLAARPTRPSHRRLPGGNRIPPPASGTREGGGSRV